MVSARSASKIYDGQPLTCADVRISGLPDVFTAQASAAGSRTDAGESANVVDTCVFYNAYGEDVTDHFTNVKTVEGRLTVHPAPLFVWTGSAAKNYDGKPLTNRQAGIDGCYIAPVPRYEDQVRNGLAFAYAQEGCAYLYVINGVLPVYGCDPATGELLSAEVPAGSRVSVAMADGHASLVVENAALPADIPTENWISHCAAVHITVDGAFADQTLDADAARFIGVSCDEGITVRATGSRTKAGCSDNTYEISWGSANPANYELTEKLGYLNIWPAAVTAAPVQEYYDTAPASRPAVTAAPVTAAPSNNNNNNNNNNGNDPYKVITDTP